LLNVGETVEQQQEMVIGFDVQVGCMKTAQFIQTNALVAEGEL
jgi:hypothetical protein